MLAAFFIHNDCFEGMDVLNHKRIIVCSIFMKQFKNFIILFITCISQICNHLIMSLGGAVIIKNADCFHVEIYEYITVMCRICNCC